MQNWNENNTQRENHSCSIYVGKSINVLPPQVNRDLNTSKELEIDEIQ